MKNGNRIAGKYLATTLILPLDPDGISDILARGGLLRVQLSAEYEVKGYLVMPQIQAAGFSRKDMVFGGRYTLAADTVFFENTLTPLDGCFFVLTHRENDFLECEAQPGGAHIVLAKV